MKKRLIIVYLLLALLMTGFAGREWTQKQTTAHRIAELARSLGLPEDDPIIQRAQEIWWEEDTALPLGEGGRRPGEVPAAAEDERPLPSSADDTFPRGEGGVDLYSGVLPFETTYDPETEALAVALAQTVYGEFRGGWSLTEQACIVWTVLNRVDAGMYSSVYAALTAPYQFAYSPYAPTYDDYGRDITALARDVLYRWKLEHEGQIDVGRVLPAGYFWYSGDGRHNYFRCTYNGRGAIWFGLTSPYES